MKPYLYQISHWKPWRQKTRIGKIILKKEENNWTQLFKFKTYYVTTVIKMVWYWLMDRLIDQ